MKVKRLMRKKRLAEHSDEEETEGSLYVEDDAELSDSYQCHGNNSHNVPIVIDD